jgi:hypothetical protein
MRVVKWLERDRPVLRERVDRPEARCGAFSGAVLNS